MTPSSRRGRADPRARRHPAGLIETDILLQMRFGARQYINLRPTRLLPACHAAQECRTDDIDMIIVREITEGFYARRRLSLQEYAARKWPIRLR